jgi:membrane dipeptidase
MIPVFDGHNDALTRADADRLISGRDRGHLDLPRMAVGGMRGGIFAVFTSYGPDFGHEVVTLPGGRFGWPEAPPASHEFAAAFSSAAAGRLFALERDGAVSVGRSVADLDTAFTGDGSEPPVAVLGLEGAEAIDPGLAALDTWHVAGLRVLGPVWSRPNAFAHGVPFVFGAAPDTGPGLTASGRALVRRCAELGILVDLAHLNEAGFWDVAALEPGPLVSSHTAAWSLCECTRNLTDRQLDAVRDSGGLVGIVYACPFVRPDFADDPDTPLSAIVAHIRYVAERIGVDHVALGSDFDGATLPAGFDVAGLPHLLDELAATGFSAEELERIAWRNWRRVLEQWWRV